MSDPKLMAAATKLAEQTPQHLGQPTTPPLAWQQIDDEIIVILADGRKVRGLVPVPTPVKTPPAPSISHIAEAPPAPTHMAPRKRIRD